MFQRDSTKRPVGRPPLTEEEKTRREAAAKATRDARQYQKAKQRDLKNKTAESRSARDVKPDYPKRKPDSSKWVEACRTDLKLFYEHYFPKAFCKPWCPDHLRVIDRLEESILQGGLYALAMPRSSGKTTMVARAALWAMLFGHRRYVLIIGATHTHAINVLRTVKDELLDNDLLHPDFRCVTYCVRRVEDNGRLAKGQLFGGKRTGILWAPSKIIFPTLPDEYCDGLKVGGAMLSSLPLIGAVRGQLQRMPDGTMARPDLILLDDPQTRVSATSLLQTNQREEIVRGDALGMAGIDGKPLAAVMPCTVIRAGDLSDRLLDRQKNPKWHGERTKFVQAWPTNQKFWDRYHQVRADSLRAGHRGEEATDLYRANQAEADAGGAVSWPERFDDDEISGIQHAQNKRADMGEAAFAAEYQNEPMPAEGELEDALTADQVASKVNRLPRGIVPLKATYLTAMIDLHHNLHFWCVCAWQSDFTGAVIDYGTYPRQSKGTFTLRKANPTLKSIMPGAGPEAAMRAGLQKVLDDLLGREWEREDGNCLRIGKCLVDSGFEQSIVHEVCRRSPHAAILLPSIGKGVGANTSAMNNWTEKEGEKNSGESWILSRTQDRRFQVVFDSNTWKTFVHARLAVPLGDPSSLSIFGSNPAEHHLFSEHMTVEKATLWTNEKTGRKAIEWDNPSRQDNHYFDTCVGCTVAASILGCKLGQQQAQQPTQTPISYRKAQELKQAERRRAQQAQRAFR